MSDVIATQSLLMIFVDMYEDSLKEDEQFLESEPLSEEGKKQVKSVFNIRFWEGYRGFSRIYLETDIGGFFYDIRKHLWNVNPKNNPYTIK